MTQRYRTIVADPPWDVKRPTGWNSTANHQAGPYLELFARRNRLGWDTWGNEALNHVELTG